MPSHFRKSSLVWLAAGILILGFVFLLRMYALVSYVPGNPLTITEQGDVLQNNQIVARVHLTPAGQEIRILLVDPQNSVTTVDASATITFPAGDVQSVLSLEPISIQGTDGIQLDWQDAHTLQVNLQGMSPESYTVLVVHAPDGYFTIPWYREGLARLEGLSFLNWASIALAIILLVSIYAFWKTREIRWRGSGEQMEVPSALSPLEMAMLHHGSIRSIDIIAFILYLAEQGYLQIIENEVGVLFVRTKKTAILQDYERDFMIVLFGSMERPSRLEDILQGLNQELFSAVVSQLYVEIYDHFNAKGYFRDNPRFIHLRYKTAGILLQFVGLIFAVGGYVFLLHQFPATIILGLTLYVAGFIMYDIGYHVVPLSPASKPLLVECGRFRNYLSSGNPIGPEGKQGYLFYRLVPYALAINVGGQWRKRFAGVRWFIPSWYECPSEMLVEPEVFLGKVAALADALAEAMKQVKDPNVD